MKKILFLTFLLVIPVCSAELIVTEVMYNPLQSEYYNEYLEIYNKGNVTVNLKNYTLCGSELLPGFIDKNDTRLYLNSSLNLSPQQFALITDGSSGTSVYANFNVSNSSLSLHVSSSSICGGLDNSGKNLSLNNTTFSYSPEYGADGDGKSLHLFNDTWMADDPTPGRKYVFTVNESNSSNSTDSDNATEKNDSSDSHEDCDLGIRIYSPRVLEAEESYEYYLYLFSTEEDQEATVEYKIEDLFGEEVRDSRETDLESEENKSRSFTPPQVTGSRAYLIKAEIEESTCDSNDSNNEDVLLIAAKGSEETSEEEDSDSNQSTSEEKKLEILDLPQTVKQGENFTATVKLNKLGKAQIYSYVYFSQDLASEGGWAGNRKMVKVEESKAVEVQNKIKKEALPGFWNFKVKVRTEEDEYEIKDELEILEKEFSDSPHEKETSEEVNTTFEEGTGATTYESEKEERLDWAIYLVIVILILLGALFLKNFKKNNFFKNLKLFSSNGQKGDKSEDK